MMKMTKIRKMKRNPYDVAELIATIRRLEEKRYANTPRFLTEYELDFMDERYRRHRARRAARSAAVERLMSQALDFAKGYQRSNVVLPIPRNFTGVITIKIRIE